ncbi:MAG: Pyrrolo-quinoline quinone [Gemmatimonadetes bacterium]|nr:Pyrrolo-quinoline quinone [Gemmatimonadota bacterium]
MGAALALPASSVPVAPAPTMFRGDAAHTGVFHATPGRALLGLQWRFETQGDVIASPAIAGDAVFVGSGDGNLYALDLPTGALRWKHAAGSAVFSSPAVAEGLVVLANRAGVIEAFDARDGHVAWTHRTGATLPFPWGHETGDIYHSSPVVVGHRVYIGAGDGALYALDLHTGATIWKSMTEGRVRSSPAVANGAVYVGSADGYLYAFDATTGARRWRFATTGVTLESKKFGFDRRTVQASPAVSGNSVFVGSRDGFLYAVDATTGAEKWRYDHQVSWVNTSPAVKDGVVYAGSSDKQFVQAVDATTGVEKWRKLTGLTWASPAIAGNVLYSGEGGGKVTAHDLATGAILWRFASEGPVFGSPVASGDLVVFGSTDGSVYALRVSADSARAPDRAVFFDTSFARAAWTTESVKLNTALRNRGYRALDAAALPAFLDDAARAHRPSTLVFAIDHLPEIAGDTGGMARRLRAFLDAGGKVVWPGVPPLLLPRNPKDGGVDKGLAGLDFAASSALEGVSTDSATFDVRGVRATPVGERWGMPARWRAGWGIADDPHITVLGRDEWGLAGAWVRSFGGAPGTGFVRVPDVLSAVYRAAEYVGQGLRG